ncbi:guanylate kinase [bacterium]|nr:MAG: guanylate kinase [bacterium]
MLFVFAAPSGTGKTSIYKHVLEDFPGLVFSVSATTRKKRDGEIDGVDYYYINREDFEIKIKNDEFIEYEKVYDDYYGTLKIFVDETVKKKENMVLDLDVNGALNIKKLYKNDSVLIFIKPPDKNEIVKRLEKRRTESDEVISKRLERFDYEMGKMNDFDYIVTNEYLDTAIKNVEEIIKKNIKK